MELAYTSGELETLAETVRYQDWIARQFRPYVHGRVMEIGAGLGTLSRYWEPLAKELHLLEPAENLLASLHKTYAGNQQVVIHGDVLEVVVEREPELAQSRFDSIVMVNVLEHIEDDSGMAKRIHRMLCSGGFFLVFVPALQQLYGTLDARFGHFRRYARGGLSRLCHMSGFKVVDLYYFDILGALPWWFFNRILKTSSLNPTAARLYDRLAVPAMRFIETKIRPPVGKNLVLIAQKS
jgi:SAM-dependent methyltransferase